MASFITLKFLHAHTLLLETFSKLREIWLRWFYLKLCKSSFHYRINVNKLLLLNVQSISVTSLEYFSDENLNDFRSVYIETAEQLHTDSVVICVFAIPRIMKPNLSLSTLQVLILQLSQVKNRFTHYRLQFTHLPAATLFNSIYLQ